MHSDPIPMRSDSAGSDSPINWKSTPTVAKTTAYSSGTSYFSPVSGGDDSDFMKLSIRSPDVLSHTATPDSARVKPTPAASVPVTGSRAERGGFRSLLLFIPLRLGQDTFNTSYADALKVSVLCA